MITAVILAAGESARLRTPKQMVVYRGKTLIAHAVETALASECDEVIVVVGAQADVVRKEIEQYPVRIVDNPNWKEGKSSSIRAAVKSVTEHSEIPSAILFLTCDQPYVAVGLLSNLIDRFLAEGGTPVATSYADTMGIPAVIPCRLFGKLLELENDQGAQEILRTIPGGVLTVACAQGSFDIDYLKDVEKLHADG
jgi:molybdenum cofactor cytidylyltransferase